VDWKGQRNNEAASGQLKITFTKVNEQQDISAPSDTPPITDLLTQLGPLLQQLQGGGLSSLGGASTTTSSNNITSGGSSSATASATQAYAQCMSVAAAGSSAAQQKCNALLSQQ